MNAADVGGGSSSGIHPGHVQGIKVFSGSNYNERNGLGREATEWLAGNPDVRVLSTIVTQSSSAQFHCVTLTLLCSVPARDYPGAGASCEISREGDPSANGASRAQAERALVRDADGARSSAGALDRILSAIGRGASGASGVRTDLSKVLTSSVMDLFSAERVESAIAFLDRLVAACDAIDEEARGAA